MRKEIFIGVWFRLRDTKIILKLRVHTTAIKPSNAILHGKLQIFTTRDTSLPINNKPLRHTPNFETTRQHLSYCCIKFMRMSFRRQRAISTYRTATRARSACRSLFGAIVPPAKSHVAVVSPVVAVAPYGQMAWSRPSAERNSGKSAFTRTRSLPPFALFLLLSLSLSLVSRSSFPCNRHSSHGNNGKDRASERAIRLTRMRLR